MSAISNSPPVSALRNLKISQMPPTTRSRTRPMPVPYSIITDDIVVKEEGSANAEEQLHHGSDPENDEDRSTVQSPTRLTYRIDQLSEKTKNAVRDVFNEPPKIAIEKCRRMDDTYAFQMTELVTRTVRIKASSTGSERLMCSCNTNRTGGETCEHLFWLLDQLVKQTLYDHDHNKPLTMNSNGYAEEMGDPFQNLVNYHLDILAQDFRCQHLQPENQPVGYDDSIDEDGYLMSPDDGRFQDSQEIIASFHDDMDRPDIFDYPIVVGKDIIQPQDLDYSVFRMLLDNAAFFQYFLSKTNPNDAIHDPFMKLSRRIDRVLRDLDNYSASSYHLISQSPPATPDLFGVHKISTESQQNVEWASRHINGVIRIIRSYIFAQDDPLPAGDALCAARALTHILASVVSRNKDAHPGKDRHDRNLYLRLIGDKDQNFVVGELSLIPGAASQFLHNLEAILEQIAIHGAPATYVSKFRVLNSSLHKQRAGNPSAGGRKRSSQSPMLSSKIKRAR